MTQQPDTDTELLLAKAMAHFREGDMEGAATALRQVLEVDPTHLQAQNYLTVVESRLNPQLEVKLRKTERAAPERRVPEPTSAEERSPPPGKAMKAKVQDRTPKRADERRAASSLQLGRILLPLLAVAVLAGVAILGRDYIQQRVQNARIRQAKEGLVRGDRIDALQVLEKAAREKTDDWETLELLGDTYLELKRPKDAVQSFERITDSGQASPGVYAKLGHAAFAAEDVKTAVWAFQKAHAKGAASDEDLLVLARAYESLGMLDEAIETYRRRISRVPSDQGTHLDLARAYRRSDRFRQAEAEYREVIRIEPFSNEAYIGLGETLESSGKLSKAIEAYMKPLGWEPDNRDILGRLGWLLLTQGNRNQAETQFRRLLVLDSRDPVGRAGMAAVFLYAGDLEQAERYARKALSRRKGQTPKHYLLLAEILQRTNRPAEALAACDRALSLDQNSADAWEKKGEILFTTRQIREARLALGRALEIDPGRKKSKELLRRTSRL